MSTRLASGAKVKLDETRSARETVQMEEESRGNLARGKGQENLGLSPGGQN
jgi:hypothetical protein